MSNNVTIKVYVCVSETRGDELFIGYTLSTNPSLSGFFKQSYFWRGKYELFREEFHQISVSENRSICTIVAEVGCKAKHKRARCYEPGAIM
jgi:hypothetical protein